MSLGSATKGRFSPFRALTINNNVSFTLFILPFGNNWRKFARHFNLKWNYCRPHWKKWNEVGEYWSGIKIFSNNVEKVAMICLHVLKWSRVVIRWPTCGLESKPMRLPRIDDLSIWLTVLPSIGRQVPLLMSGWGKYHDHAFWLIVGLLLMWFLVKKLF